MNTMHLAVMVHNFVEEVAHSYLKQLIVEEFAVAFVAESAAIALCN